MENALRWGVLFFWSIALRTEGKRCKIFCHFDGHDSLIYYTENEIVFAIIQSNLQIIQSLDSDGFDWLI